MKVVLAVWILAKKLNSVHMWLKILRNLQKYGPARLCQKVAWKSKFFEHFHLWWKCNFCFEKFSFLGCFLSAATNILKKPQNKSHLATLVVWQHLSYTNSCEILKFVHYNNHTSWVQSCDWWAGRQLAVGAKAGYQRPVDGQVDGGVVKQDAGAIIRLAVGSWWRCWRYA